MCGSREGDPPSGAQLLHLDNVHSDNAYVCGLRERQVYEAHFLVSHGQRGRFIRHTFWSPMGLLDGKTIAFRFLQDLEEYKPIDISLL